MPMNWDIIRRIKKDFPESDVDAAIEVLEQAKAEHPRWSNRILRCSVYMAQGEIDRLRTALKVAETDWRDLIVAAEYEGLERVRDFNRTFGGQEIKKR